MTVVAAELIQSMCFAVAGSAKDTSEASGSVINGTPPKVRDAALSLIRSRLHAPGGRGILSYMDNLKLKLEVVIVNNRG